MRPLAKRLSRVLCVTLCVSFLPSIAFANARVSDDAEESERPFEPLLPDSSSLSPSDDASFADPTTGIAKRKKRPKKARKPRIRKHRKHAT